MTVVIFIVTLTVAGPAFPIIIIALVPFRLLLMNKIWTRETLRYVDSWACRDGTPEGDHDQRMVEAATNTALGEPVGLSRHANRDVEMASPGAESSSVETEENRRIVERR